MGAKRKNSQLRRANRAAKTRLNRAQDPNPELAQALQCNRLAIKLQSTLQSYGPSQQIKFSIPAVLADLKGCYIKCNILGSLGAGATFVRLTKFLNGWIDRVTVKLGSEIIADIQQYSDYASAVTLSKPWAAQYNPILYNMTDATRATQTVTADTAYIVPLDLIDVLQHTFPLDRVNQQLDITIYTKPAAECLESDGVASYTISNVNLHFDQLVDIPVEYDAEINTAVNGDGWLMPAVNNINCSRFDGISGTSYSQNLAINKSDARQVLFIIKESADLDDFEAVNKFNTTKTGFTDFYMSVNGKVTPQNRTSMVNDLTCQELWKRYLKSMEVQSGSASSEGAIIAAQLWSTANANGNVVIPVVDLRGDFETYKNGKKMDNGIDFTLPGSQSSVTFNTRVALTSGVMYAFVQFQSIVKLRSNGVEYIE